MRLLPSARPLNTCKRKMLLCLPALRYSLALRCALAVLACIVLSPVSAGAEGYMPLGVGNQWYYENDLAETQLMTIIGEATVLGIVTRVRRQEMPTDLFENYWTRDGSGHLYLHGARNLLDDFEVAYHPPIRMVDAPLEEGKTWVTEGIRLYDLDGTPWGEDPFDYPLRVYFEGEVSVPAGLFYAYGIAWDQGPAVLQLASFTGHDLFGCRVLAGDRPLDGDITDWYSDGVGLVKHTTWAGGQHAFDLHWWSIPVSTEPCSWGRIKSLYR